MQSFQLRSLETDLAICFLPSRTDSITSAICGNLIGKGVRSRGGGFMMFLADPGFVGTLFDRSGVRPAKGWFLTVTLANVVRRHRGSDE